MPIAWRDAGSSDAGVDADFRVRVFDADVNGSPWSALLEKRPLAYDNTACGPPSLAVETDSGGGFVVTAAIEVAELRAVYVVVEVAPVSSGIYVETDRFNVRPGVLYDELDIGSYTPGPTPVSYQVRARTYTSNDTAGTAATYTFTVPAT